MSVDYNGICNSESLKIIENIEERSVIDSLTDSLKQFHVFKSYSHPISRQHYMLRYMNSKAQIDVHFEPDDNGPFLVEFHLQNVKSTAGFKGELQKDNYDYECYFNVDTRQAAYEVKIDSFNSFYRLTRIFKKYI